MQLRRMVTTFVLTFALSVLLLGRWAGDSAEQGSQPPYDGDMTILDHPRQDTPAVLPTETVATPKGDRVVAPARVGHDDIPLTALLAYQRAAGILAAVEPSCGLSWTLLAAIGRVESDHGRHAGAVLGTDGVSRPQVVGVALDGGGQVARIRDTDQGRIDGDRTWDRAVGPMQFLPSTWDLVAVDGDGDGVRSVDDIDDAALGAAVYLCAGPERNLRDPSSMRAALLRYNDSAAYVALVMAYERRYRTGEFKVLASDGEVAQASAVLAARPLSGTPLRADSPLERRRQARLKSDVREAVAATERTGGTTPGVSAPSPTPSASAGSSGSPEPQGAPSEGPQEPSAPAGSDAPAPGEQPDGTGTSSPPSETPPGSDTSAPGGEQSGSPTPAGADGGGSPTPEEPTTCPATPPDGPASQPPGDQAAEPPSDSPTQDPQAPAECKDPAADDPANDPAESSAPCEPTCPEPPDSGSGTP